MAERGDSLARPARPSGQVADAVVIVAGAAGDVGREVAGELDGRRGALGWLSDRRGGGQEWRDECKEGERADHGCWTLVMGECVNEECLQVL